MKVLNEVEKHLMQILVDDAIDYIQNKYPGAIKFNPDRYSRTSIGVYIACNEDNTYRSMILSYGILFALALVKFLAEKEMYESCDKIIKAIKSSNEIYKSDLPFSIDSEDCERWLNMTPSEMLEELISQSEKSSINQ